VLIALVFTMVMAFGSLRMKLDPSFDGMMPDDLEVIRMQDHLNGIRINRYHARRHPMIHTLLMIFGIRGLQCRVFLTSSGRLENMTPILRTLVRLDFRNQ